MSKFTESAKKATVLSDVMTGRTKMDTDEIIKRYPDGITLTELDFITIQDPKKGESHTFPVLAFKEDSKACFFGGAILNKIALEWVSEYDGDIALTSSELALSGGVKVRMYSKKTKLGNNLTAVDIL